MAMVNLHLPLRLHHHHCFRPISLPAPNPDPVPQWRQASSQRRPHSPRLRSPPTPRPRPRLTRPGLCLNGSTLHPDALTHKRSSQATGPPPCLPLHSPSQSDRGRHQAHHHAALSAVRHPQRRARTKSPECPATREIGVMANTLPPSQDIKTIVNGHVTAFVESVYNLCISVLTPEANSAVVSDGMTLAMRNFFVAYLHRDPPPPQHPPEWTPPKFADVYDYCYNLCKEDRSIIPFGTYKGESVRMRANPRVECWDGDTDSFRDEGILTISHGKRVCDVVITVIGRMARTGTGVLLDKSGNVWLYNPANAVDEPIPDTKLEQATIILKTGSCMTKDTEWQVEDIYEQAKIEFVESDDESDVVG